MPLRAAVLLVLASVSGSVPLAAGPVIVPSGDLPASVVALGPLDQASGFDLSSDRAVAVAAFPSTRNTGRSVLRVSRGDALKEIELAGAVRAVALADDGQRAYAIVVEIDRKGVVRSTTLVRVDLAGPKVAITITLPLTAGGLAPAAGGRALLVASRDEIRTFFLPALTSGPLYRIPGDNVAVAPVAGTTRAVVAQGASLAIVDLAGAQDRDGLKIQERIDTGSPLRQLVASPDEAVALALTASGEALDVTLDPLHVTPRGPVTGAAWPGTAAAPPPAPSPAAAAPAAAAAAAATTPESPVNPDPQATPPPDEKATPPPPDSPPDSAAPSPTPVEAVPPPPQAVEHVEEKAPPPVAEKPPSGSGAVRGALTGPNRSEVEAVIALGPDNVLKQAARVAPDADGKFVFAGLAPGAYRIVAAGKNGRVLVCEPPYVTIRLGPGDSAEAPALSVQKGY